MPKKITDTEQCDVVVYMPPTAADSLKLLSIGAKGLRTILNEILIDSDIDQNTKLGDYYKNTLHYTIANMPVQNYVLLDCTSWLRENKFEHFTVSKIFVRYNEKEIIVIADKINDNVLEEFYAKTFDFAYGGDNEIVFIITDEKSVNYSAMPKYDKLIEVSAHE